MGKKFTKIIMASSNEVSLCSKYNSGANKQTEFEIIKDKEGNKEMDIKPVLTQLIKFADFYEPVEAEPEQGCPCEAFKDFLNYWVEYDVNNCLYSLLSDALRNAICHIQNNEDLTKEQKVLEFQHLFDMFIEEFKQMPITKTENNTYKVSLSTNSHIQDVVENPQNETSDITKEKTSKMEKQNMFEQAIDLLKSAFGLEKTETPAEQPVVEEAPVEEVAPQTEEVVEEPVEKTEETPATEEVEEVTETAVVEEAPVTEEPAVEEVIADVEPVEKTEEVAEELVEQSEEVTEEIAKTSEPSELEVAIQKNKDLEAEIAELKKSKEEREVEIEKMSFVQKAKDEYSMLVGTPEEIGAQLYSISKSNLDESSKSFIMEQLKKVSSENKEMTEEVGSITKNAGDMTDEEVVYAQAKEIAKTKGISINKALRQIK